METGSLAAPILGKRKAAAAATKPRKQCEHGKRKDSCKDCGTGFCEHGRQKYYCIPCGGNGVCLHGKRRPECRDCKGSSFCEHGKARAKCVDCGGASICEHGRRRSQCKDCGGVSICEHNLSKWQCKDCGGSQICEHGKNRSHCRECGGSSFCEHGKNRHHCKECVPEDKKRSSSEWCVVCTDKRLSPQRILAGMQMCAECDPTIPDRIEILLRPQIKAAMEGLEPTMMDDAHLGGNGCDAKLRRPDWLWERYDEGGANHRIVSLEIDEHSHEHRDPSCDAAKVCDEMVALKTLRGEETRFIVVRFNPHEYDGVVYVSLDDRIKVVGALCLRLLDSQWKECSSLAPTVFYCYYHSKGMKHIEYMQARPDAATVVVYKQ